MKFKQVYQPLIKIAENFNRDNCYLKASVLTYYSLLSLVPFLAVVLALAKGFGYEDILRAQILESVSSQKEALIYALDFAKSLLQSSQNGLIAGTGTLVLIWTNLSLFSNLESTLNDIWLVRKGRTLWRQVSDCVLMLILCPTFFVISSSLTVFLKAYVDKNDPHSLFYSFNPLLWYFLNILPFAFSCMLFSFIYIFIPNIKRHPLWPRFAAGALAGIIFQFWQWAYVHYQVVIFNYDVVYGAFASLPLLLVWMQTSWLILFTGAEVAATIEAGAFLGRAKEASSVSREQLGVVILHTYLQAFDSGGAPLNAVQMASKWGIPVDITREIIARFQKEGLLAQIAIEDSATEGFQLMRDVRSMTIKNICAITDLHADFQIPIKDAPFVKRVIEAFKTLDQKVWKSEANISLERL